MVKCHAMQILQVLYLLIGPSAFYFVFICTCRMTSQQRLTSMQHRLWWRVYEWLATLRVKTI